MEEKSGLSVLGGFFLGHCHLSLQPLHCQKRPASPCKDTSLPFKGKVNLGEDGSVDFPKVNGKGCLFFVLCSILQVFASGKVVVMVIFALLHCAGISSRKGVKSSSTVWHSDRKILFRNRHLLHFKDEILYNTHYFMIGCAIHHRISGGHRDLQIMSDYLLT